MKFLSLAERNMKEIFRDPVSALLGVLMPLGFLVLFTSIQKNTRLEMFSPSVLTPGIIVFSFAFLIMFSAILLAKDKQSTFLIRLFTTPLKASDFILSYILPFIPLAIIQIIVCLITGTILGAHFNNLLPSAAILMALAMICICLGVILGSLFTVNQVSGIGSLLITLISLFSGAWIDLKMVGGVFSKIGYLLPFAHGVDALKQILSKENATNISTNLYVIVFYLLGLSLIAVLSFRRAMKKIQL